MPSKLMSLTDYFLSFSRDNESNPLVFSRAQVIYVDGITSVVFTRCQDHFPDISRKCTFFESLSGSDTPWLPRGVYAMAPFLKMFKAPKSFMLGLSGLITNIRTEK